MDQPSARAAWVETGVPESFDLVRQGSQAISRASMAALLLHFIKQGFKEIRQVYPEIDTFDVNRQRALYNMYYQMGINTLKKFRNSNRYINNQQWEVAANNLKKSRWYSQTPNRANRVINLIQYG